MSNVQNNNKAAAAPSKHSPAPDGKSRLPNSLPDFPAPGTGGGTDPGSPSEPSPK